jgi:hypothetical protein
MRVITVLNRCTEFKRFVFEGSHLDEQGRNYSAPETAQEFPGGVQRLRPSVTHL